VNFIVPNDAVSSIRKLKAVRGINSDDVFFSVPDDYIENRDQEIRATFHGSVVVFKAIDSAFPDYKRVIPAQVSGKPGQYDAEYLYRCKKAAECFSKKGYFALGMNGENGAALATITSEMVAVVMPYRGEPAKADDAAWAREKLPELPVKESADAGKPAESVAA